MFDMLMGKPKHVPVSQKKVTKPKKNETKEYSRVKLSRTKSAGTISTQNHSIPEIKLNLKAIQEQSLQNAESENCSNMSSDHYMIKHDTPQ